MQLRNLTKFPMLTVVDWLVVFDGPRSPSVAYFSANSSCSLAGSSNFAFTSSSFDSLTSFFAQTQTLFSAVQRELKATFATFTSLYSLRSLRPGYATFPRNLPIRFSLALVLCPSSFFMNHHFNRPLVDEFLNGRLKLMENRPCCFT